MQLNEDLDGESFDQLEDYAHLVYGSGLLIQWLSSPMVLEILGLFSSPFYIDIDYP